MKRTWIAYLLWLVGGFGVLGLHRFYLGRWVTGLIWLLTGGLFFVGSLIDLILIPGMVRIEVLSLQFLHHSNDSAGRPDGRRARAAEASGGGWSDSGHSAPAGVLASDGDSNRTA